MFVAKTTSGDQAESHECRWNNLSGALKGVYLIHPSLGISVGLHHYKRYAFVCEGATILQSGTNFQRIAEHLYGIKDDVVIHICLRQSGQLVSEHLDAVPELDESIWKEGESNG